MARAHLVPSIYPSLPCTNDHFLWTMTLDCGEGLEWPKKWLFSGMKHEIWRPGELSEDHALPMTFHHSTCIMQLSLLNKMWKGHSSCVSGEQEGARLLHPGLDCVPGLVCQNVPYPGTLISMKYQGLQRFFFLN